MITDVRPVTLAEVKEIVAKAKVDNADIKSHLKKFNRLKFDKSRELEKELLDLNLLQLKMEHIVKIIDLLPENLEEISKIFVDISVSEDEKGKILEITKKYK